MEKMTKSKFVVVLIACVSIGMIPGSVGGGAVMAPQNVKDSQFEQLSAGIDDLENDRIEMEAGQSANFRFAVIGDYGDGSTAEGDVATLVKSWAPDIIVTTGDNNYNDGAATTIDENIGKHYSDFIYPYLGIYGEGAQVNRFFPSLGNHDWNTPGAQPYLDYFTLPGNERYYDFTWGSAQYFIVDSDPDEPDGNDVGSVQAKWLESTLASSDYRWKIVIMHHAPYSSGHHGSITWMQWPFGDWGADVVLSGHDHTYERISPPDDILYFVNGLGGRSRYDFPDIVEGSQVRYNEDYGAMLVDVSLGELRFRFINRQGEVIDDSSLVKPIEYLYIPILEKASP